MNIFKEQRLTSKLDIYVKHNTLFNGPKYHNLIYLLS